MNTITRLTAVATACMLTMTVPATATAADGGLKKPIDLNGVTVTDDGANYGDGFTADLTIDGDENTRWAARRANDDYRGSFDLTYTFPAETPIQRIELAELAGGDGNRINAVTVQQSTDGTTWKDVQRFAALIDDHIDTETLNLDTAITTTHVRLAIETAMRDEYGVKRQGEPNVTEVRFYRTATMNLDYYRVSATGVQLDWNDVAETTGYDVYQADARSGLTLADMTKITDQPLTASEMDVTGLDAGGEYRFVAVANLTDGTTMESGQVNVLTAKRMNGTSLESAQGASLKMPYSSLALNMEYRGRAITSTNWWNWCVSPVKGEDGRYHIFSSRFKDTMANWTVAGQIVHFVSDNPDGPYEYAETVASDPSLDYSETPDPSKVITDLPGHAIHNPRIKKVGDQYALIFILQTKDGDVSGQKIAVLVSDSVNGPWHWAGSDAADGSKPAFAVERSNDPDHWTYNSMLGTDNPDIIKVGDEYRIYFKAGLGQDSRMHYGYAYSKTLDGKYTLADEPSLAENKGYIEDVNAFVWNDTVYLLTTDNNGDNTGVMGYGVLWKSRDNGRTFRYEDAEIGFGLMKDYVKWPVTDGVDLHNGWTSKFERPAVLFDDDGVPAYFMAPLGVNVDGGHETQSFVFKINLKPRSDKTITSVAGASVGALAADGTSDKPAAGRVTLPANTKTVAATDIKGKAQRIDLYADAAFSKTVESVPVAGDKAVKALYVKASAEDRSEAYYRIDLDHPGETVDMTGVRLTDSGNWGREFFPANVLDGDTGTRWAAKRVSGSGEGSYALEFRSGKAKTFTGLTMRETPGGNGDRIMAVDVQAYVDGAWHSEQRFEGLKGNGADNETLALDKAVTAKRFRLVFTASDDPNVDEIAFTK